MINRNTLRGALLGSTVILGALLANNASAAMLITEVYASGSSNGTYNADWFELTNTGSSAVSISGWKMDDNSASSSLAVALRGVTSIGAGQSVVFLEGDATGSSDASIQAAFKSAWFGSNVPVGLTLAGYGGSGVGLGSSADAVNIYDSSNTLIASVSFNATTTGKTFDNAAGLNNATISQLSAVGVNGAFLSANGAETGSPGVVPLPAAGWLLFSGLGLLGGAARRKKTAI